MPDMTLHIKNMVCRRCILAVTQLLEKNGLHPSSVTLGEVVLPNEITPEQESALRADLEVLANRNPNVRVFVDNVLSSLPEMGGL